MAEKEYRRFGPRGRRKGEPFTWTTLWLGRDHILQVEHTGYSEEYRRFYFADIQSITMRKDKRALQWTITFLVMIAAGAGLALYMGVSDGTPGALVLRYAVATWVALWLLLLVINLIKGPGCICYIQTAVQQEQLPSLKRVKKSRKIIARLRELIGSAQGLLNSEEARARYAAGEHLRAAPAETNAPPPPLA